MTDKQTMMAFVITGPRTASIQAVDRYAPELGEVVVRSRAVAVCTLERRIFSGAKQLYPCIGGHELAGIVEWVDERRSDLRCGDHVAVDVMVRCRSCVYCQKGSDNLCVELLKPRKSSKFLSVGGGFAEYINVPSNQALRLPKNLSLEQASLIEPLACCLHSVKRAQISSGATVAILGAGTMGTLHVLLAKLAGAIVIVSDPDESRLRFAEQHGADHTVNPKMIDPVQFIREHTAGRGADSVIVTVGDLTAGEQALDIVARTGRVIFYASLHPTAAVRLDWNAIHYQEITVTGSANNTHLDFQEATALLTTGALDLGSLVSKVISLGELSEELSSHPTGETQRVVVRM